MKRSLPMTVCFWMTTMVVATPPGGGSVGPDVGPVGPPVASVGPGNITVTVTLKGLSHEIDFKKFDKNLQTRT
jgi:hypothetical protein